MGEHFDVVVVGAGISGIGAGYFLQRDCPDRSYVILEGRERSGGTWDLFRYPGIRSDSDMYTLGYSFRPWTQAKAIADGPSILHYLDETAREYGIDRHIRHQHKVIAASWSSDQARWTLTVERGPDREIVEMSCNFLFSCTGYYNYEAGYSPRFEGSETFAGRIVHPQHWPDNLDYTGKRVVVIGSGATAVTLVPEMAKTAAHVTMLQRSPTYIVSRPSQDALANWLRRKLPARLAYRLTRIKNVSLQQLFFRLARKNPEKTRERLLQMVRDELPGHDIETHFTPRYNPWDQRLCLVPDADLFAALREERASVVTGHIDRFEETGIRLKSGDLIEADVIVTATGLDLKLIGGIELDVDGVAKNPAQSLSYKGMMFSGIPNLAYSFGYTNASWTLKSDLTAAYLCRLLNAMKRRRMRQVTPRLDASVTPERLFEFTSGYIERAVDRMPRQGDRKPWRVPQNYTLDLMALRFGGIDQDMEFSNPAPAAARSRESA
ncbi:NAD(P)/FAD-dependent oxidoreductase [Sphingomonas sp.]|uniref:flavin-containing monooxygenase n=1 Tax=Sphingomonas sp. TaxID=28214 RepID=UPI001ED01007|nr:NAD(P)/FAD-dependent oxidoreductase [Sphingomonas sp.]MBX3594683.1 NAD(P)/FAD-dependent oxidoreductase [Sphingomonas sp.]